MNCGSRKGRRAVGDNREPQSIAEERIEGVRLGIGLEKVPGLPDDIYSLESEPECFKFKKGAEICSMLCI